MKNFVKLLALVFLAVSVFYVFSSTAVMAFSKNRDAELNYLLVGFDEAPSNTDVLILVSCNLSDNVISAIQIPRDIYFSYGDKAGKINGFYSNEISKGKSKKEALSSLALKISDSLGVKINGAVGIERSGFVDTVNFLGGVDVVLPIDSKYPSESKSNVLHLDGKKAFDFVRYRHGYVRGDLERIDAQKLFIKALLGKIFTSNDLFSLFRLLTRHDGVFFTEGFARSALPLLRRASKLRSARFQIETLPGVAAEHNKVWYYVVDPNKSRALMEKYFPHSEIVFDKNKNFLVIKTKT